MESNRFVANRRTAIWQGSLRCILLTVCTISIMPALAGQLAYTSPKGTPVLIYTPPSYGATPATHPLLIFLHGEQETGGSISSLSSSSGELFPSRLVASGKWDERLPFIIVSPLLKVQPGKSKEWSPETVDELVRFVQSRFRTDMSRVYFMGVGTGAIGCWKYASRFPAKVNAIVSIGALFPESTWCELPGVPLWGFLGDNETVAYAANIKQYAQRCQPRFRKHFTRMPARGLQGWSSLYSGDSGHNIYGWFLKFKGASNGNVPPYVNAGPDKIIAANSNLTLSADFFDSDGEIAHISWKQVAGKPLKITEPKSAFLTLNNLTAGLYEFRLAVRDDTGAESHDRVRIEVLAGANQLSVKNLTLTDAITGKDVLRLHDGAVIDKSWTGVSAYNVRAEVSSATASVMYAINSDAATGSSSGKTNVLGRARSVPWRPANETCVICATPYNQPGGRGTAGASHCVRVVFSESGSVSKLLQTKANQSLIVRSIDDVIVSNSGGSGNQWVLDGKDIPGATGPIFKPQKPGKYYVRNVNRATNDVSNLVYYRQQPDNFKPNNFEVVPTASYLVVKGKALPPRSSYRILKGEVLVQQGELFSDKRITIGSNLSKGNYVLLVNTRNIEDGVKFTIK